MLPISPDLNSFSLTLQKHFDFHNCSFKACFPNNFPIREIQQFQSGPFTTSIFNSYIFFTILSLKLNLKSLNLEFGLVCTLVQLELRLVWKQVNFGQLYVISLNSEVLFRRRVKFKSLKLKLLNSFNIDSTWNADA